MSRTTGEEWWRALYDDIVAELLLVRKDDAQRNATITFLREHLALTRGAVLFDQCCGIGSLSLPLAREGVAVIGVDQCAAYIDRARRDGADLPCTFHAGDAFSFVADRPCHAAVNWGTSFGNADD